MLRHVDGGDGRLCPSERSEAEPVGNARDLIGQSLAFMRRFDTGQNLGLERMSYGKCFLDLASCSGLHSQKLGISSHSSHPRFDAACTIWPPSSTEAGTLSSSQ